MVKIGLAVVSFFMIVAGVGFIVSRQEPLEISPRVKKWRLILFIIIILMICSTALEVIFNQFYEKHFQIIRVIDNVLMFMCGIVIIISTFLSTYDWNKRKKEQKRETSEGGQRY